MFILITTIVTFLICIFVYWCGKILKKEKHLEGRTLYKIISNVTAYGILMYMIMLIYVMFIIKFPIMNPVQNSLLLLTLIWIGNLLVGQIIEERYIKRQEKKVLCLVAISATAITLFLLALLEKSNAYIYYALLSTSVIVGFLVSLDTVVLAKSVFDIKKQIVTGLDINNIRKSVILIAMILLGLFIAISLAYFYIIPKKIWQEVILGFVTGVAMFFITMIIIIKRKRLA